MKKIVIAILVFMVGSLLVFAGGGKEDSNTFPVGAVFPLSGAVAFYGNESRDGALLAIDEVNAAGGLLGKKLVLLSEDDEGRCFPPQ